MNLLKSMTRKPDTRIFVTYLMSMGEMISLLNLVEVIKKLIHSVCLSVYS